MIEAKKIFNIRQKEFYYQTVSPPHALLRFFIKRLIRILVWILIDFEINGKENLPKKGPAILIGNHMEMLESALILGVPPRQIEIFSAIDFPYDPPILQTLINAYGVIPIFRGRPDKKPLKTAISVLKKNGFIGLFPEGSTWEPGLIKPKSGFAWMSYQAEAPVIPIGFSFLIGSLNQAFKLKRPRVVMTIGEMIPALAIQNRQNKKTELEAHTDFCWQKVLTLLEPEEYARYTDVTNERFEIEIKALDEKNELIQIPEQYQLTYIQSYGLFVFRTMVYSLFIDNYKKPVEPLLHLHERPSAQEIKHATISMLDILEDEQNGNPYAISFHLGEREGEEINESLHQIIDLCDWAITNNLTLHINPKRIYFSNIQHKEIIQTVQIPK